MIIIKTKKQIEGISKSCKLARAALDYIRPYVVAGVTTGRLNELLEVYIREHGAIPAPLGYRGGGDRPYPAATCISLNEVVCHGIPGERTLVEGDILNIDVTTILEGFYGDVSSMFMVGSVSPEARRLIDVTRRCLKAAIKVCKPGARIGVIGYEINKLATKEGCSVVNQFCGHGVGLQFHEEPQIPFVAPREWGPPMRRGMVFTIEPMINLGVAEAVISDADGWTASTKDGQLSAQFEHTILITDKGHEVLTI